MDFYAMKRKRLQTLCKKHGIPANLKNKEMAEKLSLLYKEKENKKGTTFHCVGDKDKLNVEIIELDSDSDDTNSVQMEASDTVAEKDKTNVTVSEVKSSELNIHQMVSSGTAAGNADAAEVKLVSSEKMRQVLEESKINLPPERRDRIGLSSVEENLHMVVNKEQVDDNQELHPAAPSAELHVASEEFGNYLVVEEEVEKLSEKTDVHEDTCGTGRVGDEAEIQDHINSPQGSNINYVNHLNVSLKESTGCVFEGEVHKLDGETNVSVEDILDEVHSSSFADPEGTPVQSPPTDPLSEVNTSVPMEASDTVAEKDMTNVTLTEVKSSELNIHQMVASGTAAGNADAAEVKFASSEKMSQVLEESKMNLPPERREDIGSFSVEENLHMVVNKEQVDDNQELHPAAPSAEVHLASEEFGNYLVVEGEVENLSEKTDVYEDTCGTGRVGDEAQIQDHINSPQGSNINYVNHLHASLKESTGCVFEEEVHKLDDDICVHGAVSEASTMCLDASIGAKDTDVKTNLSVEDILEEVHSSSFEDSDGTPVQSLPTDPLSEVNTSDLDVHNMVVQGTATKNVDSCDTKSGSSQKISISPTSEKMIGFPPKLLNNSETPIDEMGLCDVKGNMQIGVNKVEVSHSEEVLHAMGSDVEENMQIGVNKKQVEHSQEVLHTEPGVVVMKEDLVQVVSEDMQVDDMRVCDVVENMQFGVNKEQLDHSQEVLHAEPSVVVTNNDEGLVQVASEDMEVDDKELCDVGENMQIGVNEEQVDHNQEVLHTEPSVVVMNDDKDVVKVASEELGNDLVEGEVEKLDENIELLEDVCGSAKGRDEAPKQGGINSPQGSNIEDRNNISEAATMCLDASKGTEDTDGRTNVTVEHIRDEVYSSSFEDSDGTSIQFLPADPLGEVKTSDPDVHKMVVQDTCGSNSAKFVSSQKISISQASEKGIGFSPRLLNNSERPIDDVEENMQTGVNKEQVGHSQESLDADPSVVVMKNDEELVQAASEEFGKNVAEGEVEKFGDIIELLEEICGTEKGIDETVKQGGINSPQGSNISPGESSSPLVGGEVQKSCESILHGGVDSLGKSGSGVDALCFLDSSFAAKDTEGKTNLTMERFSSEGHSSSVKYCSYDTPDQFLTTDQLSELMCSDLNIHQMDALDTCEEMVKSPQKTGMTEDPEECIGFSPNNHEASANKGFEAETYFDQCTFGDVVGICNMKASTQSDMMEKGNSKEECSLVEGEVPRLFDNYDAHDDNGGIGAEDENKTYMMSHKRKRSDLDNNTNGPNSDENEKADEFVSIMPQFGEMESCNFNLHQIFASGSDTVSGDERTCQEKLESSPKGTPIVSSKESIIFTPKLLESSRDIVGTCDMKENIKFDKKEQVGSIISKKKIAKRQPLQNLQQN